MSLRGYAPTALLHQSGLLRRPKVSSPTKRHDCLTPLESRSRLSKTKPAGCCSVLPSGTRITVALHGQLLNLVSMPIAGLGHHGRRVGQHGQAEAAAAPAAADLCRPRQRRVRKPGTHCQLAGHCQSSNLSGSHQHCTNKGGWGMTVTCVLDSGHATADAHVGCRWRARPQAASCRGAPRRPG